MQLRISAEPTAPLLSAGNSIHTGLTNLFGPQKAHFYFTKMLLSAKKGSGFAIRISAPTNTGNTLIQRAKELESVRIEALQ